MQQVKQGKQIYVKVKIVPYSAKSFYIIVDFNRSNHQFDNTGLKHFSGHEYHPQKLKLEDGSIYRIKPARFMHEVEYEIVENNVVEVKLNV